MKKLTGLVVLCWLVFGGCIKKGPAREDLSAGSSSNGFKEYIIIKGNHYSDQTRQEALTVARLSCQVIFDSSAIYQNTHTDNQDDVNKLIGFSDCGSQHHENSARLGWNWDGGQLVIYAYAYVNQIRIIKSLGPVPLNQAFSCLVEAKGSFYYFGVDGQRDSIPRQCAAFNGYFYKLFPYFGGDETAPHDIRIRIREL